MKHPGWRPRAALLTSVAIAATLGFGGPALAQSNLDDSFNPGANARVWAVVVQPDGKILVGGEFTMLGGGGTGAAPRNYIGRFNADGSLDKAFDPGTDSLGLVFTLALQPDGKILVGGAFTSLGGVKLNRIGRLNADGSLDDRFNPGADADVTTMVVQPDGKILVGGRFRTLGGGGTGTTKRSYIGRLNADGSLDAKFDPGANASVEALALQKDAILVGGAFTTLGGGGTGTTKRSRLGRLNADGSLDTSFDPGANATVSALTVQPDGKILVGGAFGFLGGGGSGAALRSFIGRLNADGSLDKSFDPGANDAVLALTLQKDGKILVGGAFMTLGGGGSGTSKRSNIGRLEADGSPDPKFDPGANNPVNALTLQPDGKVLVAGQFTTLGGGGTGTTKRSYIGRLNAEGSAPSAGGLISGTITNTASGAAIAGVTVTFYDSLGSYVGTSSTSSSGVYTSSSLPAGTYFARTTNGLGLIDELFDDVNCASGCSVLAGKPITVAVDATTTVDFALTPAPIVAGRISGTVTSESSAAGLVNISVLVYNTSGRVVTSSLTDRLGDYTTDTLADGSYYVRTLNDSGYVDEVHLNQICLLCLVTKLGTPVAVRAPSTTTVNFSLQASGWISGTVTDTNGIPLASISIDVYSPTGDFITSGVTDAKGNYTTPTVIPGGAYFVRTSNTSGYINQVFKGLECLECNPSTGTAVKVIPGQPTAGIDFALRGGGRITGTITADATGAGIPGVTVSIFTTTGVFVTSGYTDAAGRYATDNGLATGAYYAWTSNTVGFVDETYDNLTCVGCKPTVGTPIRVAAGVDASGVDFSLAASGGITGTIVDAATSQPLTGAQVEVFSSSGVLMMSVFSDGLGRYVTGSGLGTGKYFLRASSPQGYVAEVFDNLECAACSPITGTAVSVGRGQTTTNVNFSLARGGSITGIVTDAGSGQALQDVTVSLYNKNNNFVASALTDETGYFASGSRLPDGTYFARTSNSQGYVDQIYNGTICVACTPNTGTGITVTAGQAAPRIAFQLSSGARLAGTVIETGSNKPLATVTVDVYNQKGALVTSGTTDNAGAYQTAVGLGVGTYFARTTNGQGYIDKVFDNAVCLACDPTRGTPIVIASLTKVPGVNFSLSPGGRVAGTITATGTGAAISNVRVEIHNLAGALVSDSSSNAAGAYLTTGLPPGSYRLRTFNLQGFIDEAFDNQPCKPCPINAGTPVDVMAAATVGGVNFVLDGGGWVSGWVSDAETRAPLKGVIVSFYQNSDGAFVARSSPSDASGYYAISLPAGAYSGKPDPVQGYIVQATPALRAAAVGNVAVEVGLETPGVEFSLTACTPPSIASSTLPIATAGQSYGVGLSASGGTGSLKFSVTSGSLPPGLSLTENGQIAGTPSTLGTANFSVAVTDANGCSTTQSFAQFTCGITLGETSATFAAGAGTRQVDVAANASDCGWSASASDSWVTITKGSGAGSGALAYTVAANPSTAARTATITVGSQTYTVTQNGQPVQTQPDPPIGSFDTPATGTTVTGSIAVTGWTLSKAGIDRVEIWRDLTTGETTTPFNSPGHPGDGKVFVARGTFVRGARPDVAQSFSGYPNADRAGWGYLLLTQGLWNVGNGTFTLYAFAFDVDGQAASLCASRDTAGSCVAATKTITANNAQSVKPFGALDTPGYGATVSGGFWNYGWALTPNGNTTDPRSCVITDGNIYVGIDSQQIVPVHYGDTRSDIAGFFPGFSNGSSAGGAYYIDTTALGNGDHQIGWYVVDSCGRADGIGSRIFTVLNGVNITTEAAPRVLAPDALAALVVGDAGPIQVRTDDVARQSVPDDQGVHVIAIAQRSRIEVELPKVEGARYRGGEIVGGLELALPLGSSLDAERGVFYWEPAPAFLGSYELVFVAGDPSTLREPQGRPEQGRGTTGSGSSRATSRGDRAPVRVRVVVEPPQ